MSKKGIIGVIASAMIIAALAIPKKDSKIVNDISQYNNRLNSIIEATK